MVKGLDARAAHLGITRQAGAALSAPDQDRLADLIAAYVASHAVLPDFPRRNWRS